MTEQEFRDLWVACSGQVADEFHPKGQGAGSETRGTYLRDQGVLYAYLVKMLNAKGLFDEHRDPSQEEVPGQPQGDS
jgi:hypothetical protein